MTGLFTPIHRLVARFGIGLTIALLVDPASILAENQKTAGQIDRLAQPYVEGSVVKGMAVGVVRGDEKLVRGYGRVASDPSEKPDEATIFEIGSVTKTFTALLLADSVVRGELRLDQPLGELLPAEGQLQAHSEGPITLKHLATHVSGLPRLPDNLAPADNQDPYAEYSQDDLYAFLQQHALQRGPGVQQEYSNLAFGLLGQLLADRAGKTYGELVQERIAEPLKMNDTRVELTPSMRARLAPPFNADLAPDKNWRFQSIAGAGAIRSTADDMLRYAAAYLDPPDNELGEAIELAWKIQQPALRQDDFAMGLGWHIARDGNTRWHNGQTGGYHAMVMINRPLHIAVVVLSNTATMEVDVLAEQLVRMLAGSTEERRSFTKTVEVPVDTMQRLAGRYQLAPHFVLTVKVDDGKLMVGATGQATFQVYPSSETEWRYRVVDARLTFEIAADSDEPAKAVVLHQGGIEQRAERVK